MDRRTFFLLLGSLLSFVPGSLAAQAPAAPVPIIPADPVALRRDIEAAHLDPARAVTLKGVKLAAGLATLHLDDGVLLPASPVGGKTIELVFLGRGRIVLEPPDRVEAGQLELFTGGSRLDEEFKEAVLVVGLDPAVNALLKKPAAQPDAQTAKKAEDLYTQWKAKPERKQLNVETGILGDALGDPAWQGYEEVQFVRRLKNALIDLSRARLFLEANRDADAEKALDRSDKLSDTAEWKLLKSRLEIRRGDYDKAFRRLRKGLGDIGGLDNAEANLLLAIAAKATHHKEEYDRAVKAARESGVEMALLSGGQ